MNFHQPLFPHYTGRVFNIQVGGSLKGTNFGNPHLEKHSGFLWLFSSKDLKGLPSKIWDPWQHFKVVGDKSCRHSLADEKKKEGQIEGTMRQKVTIESRMLCLKLLCCCLQTLCVPLSYRLIVIMYKIIQFIQVLLLPVCPCVAQLPGWGAPFQGQG